MSREAFPLCPERLSMTGNYLLLPNSDLMKITVQGVHCANFSGNSHPGLLLHFAEEKEKNLADKPPHFPAPDRLKPELRTMRLRASGCFVTSSNRSLPARRRRSQAGDVWAVYELAIAGQALRFRVAVGRKLPVFRNSTTARFTTLLHDIQVCE